jgi:hypothetical protein
MLLRLALAGCVVAVLLGTASPALAGTREQILQECQDGRLAGNYSAKQIRDARNHIPTDIDQYSDCSDVLSRALAAKASSAGGGTGGGSGGGSGGSGGTDAGGTGPLLTPSTPADTQALQSAGEAGGRPVKVGEQAIAPGPVGLASGAPRTGLPGLVIAVLALLGVAALAGGVPLARRVPGLATITRRVLRR